MNLSVRRTVKINCHLGTSVKKRRLYRGLQGTVEPDSGVPQKQIQCRHRGREELKMIQAAGGGEESDFNSTALAGDLESDTQTPGHVEVSMSSLLSGDGSVWHGPWRVPLSKLPSPGPDRPATATVEAQDHEKGSRPGPGGRRQKRTLLGPERESSMLSCFVKMSSLKRGMKLLQPQAVPPTNLQFSPRKSRKDCIKAMLCELFFWAEPHDASPATSDAVRSLQEHDPTPHGPSRAGLTERRLCRWPAR